MSRRAWMMALVGNAVIWAVLIVVITLVGKAFG